MPIPAIVRSLPLIFGETSNSDHDFSTIADALIVSIWFLSAVPNLDLVSACYAATHLTQHILVLGWGCLPTIASPVHPQMYLALLEATAEPKVWWRL